MWSSDAVAHLLQGLIYCASRDALLYTSIGKSVYLNYTNKNDYSLLATATKWTGKSFHPYSYVILLEVSSHKN